MLQTIIFVIIFLPATIFLSVSSIILGPLDKKGRTVAWVGRVWSCIALKAARIRLEVEWGDVPQDGGVVFMANHQSLLDILVLFRILHPYRVCFVAKQSLFSIPIFGYGMRKAGHVAIDRSNRRRAMKSIDEAVDRTRWGRIHHRVSGRNPCQKFRYFTGFQNRRNGHSAQGGTSYCSFGSGRHRRYFTKRTYVTPARQACCNSTHVAGH